MLMYSPREMMGKKLNTTMWVQSSWTGTVVQHFAMFPLVTANLGEENSLPQNKAHLKDREKMHFYVTEFLAAIKPTATSKRKVFRFPKICFKNVDKYIRCHLQGSSGSIYQTDLSFKWFRVTISYILMRRPHKYLWRQGVVAQHFLN